MVRKIYIQIVYYTSFIHCTHCELHMRVPGRSRGYTTSNNDKISARGLNLGTLRTSPGGGGGGVLKGLGPSTINSFINPRM
jgi:hypothetical protein